MKTIKTVGLILFITGFCLFNGLFFSADYSLTREIVKAQISDEQKQALFLQSDSSLLNQNVSSVFSFVTQIERIFDVVNQIQQALMVLRKKSYMN
jgi:hypothetical protein